MISLLKVVEETREADENHRLTQVTGNFLTCPGQDSYTGSCERQLAVIGNALDHTAIRAGPVASWDSELKCACLPIFHYVNTCFSNSKMKNKIDFHLMTLLDYFKIMEFSMKVQAEILCLLKSFQYHHQIQHTIPTQMASTTYGRCDVGLPLTLLLLTCNMHCVQKYLYIRRLSILKYTAQLFDLTNWIKNLVFCHFFCPIVVKFTKA